MRKGYGKFNMLRRLKGLRWTFIISLIGFSAVLSITFASVATYRVTTNLREQLIHRGETLVGDLAREAVRFLGLEDRLERELSLMLLTHRLTIGDVAYAQVVQDGKIVSESSSPQLPHDPPDLLPEPSLRAPMMEAKMTGGRYLDFVRPLPGHRGYVRLGLSLEVIPHEARRTLLVMGGVSLLFTGLGAVLAFALYSGILKPLERVIGSIRRLSRGDIHARAPVQGPGELRELAFAFNSMADGIVRRNRELQAVNAELRSANQAKAEFLAMIGHELKTPLHSVRGYCQLLLAELDGPLTEEQRSDITAVLTAGNHLLALIDNILSFSTSGAEPLYVRPVAFPSLLDQAVNQVRPLAQRKSVKLRVDIGSVDVIEADETKFKQVLINLLHNAVKWTPAGSVAVRAWSSHDGLWVEVQDQGPGIPPEEQERIFDPFERREPVDGMTLDESKGLGLGLAIVRRYMDAHGGTVSVHCPPEGGSCFSLFLPHPPRTPASLTEPATEIAGKGVR